MWTSILWEGCTKMNDAWKIVQVGLDNTYLNATILVAHPCVPKFNLMWITQNYIALGILFLVWFCFLSDQTTLHSNNDMTFILAGSSQAQYIHAIWKWPLLMSWYWTCKSRDFITCSPSCHKLQVSTWRGQVNCRSLTLKLKVTGQ